MDAGGLVVARQAPGVVQAPLGVVRADVVRVSLGQPLDGVLDGPAGGRYRGRLFAPEVASPNFYSCATGNPSVSRHYQIPIREYATTTTTTTTTTTNNVGSLRQTALAPHLVGAEVGVAAGAVPVASDGLGVEGHDDAKVLADAVQDEARHPQVVAHVDALCGTHLELPLRRNRGDSVKGATKP